MSKLSKVLLVGSDHVWSIERIFLKYLKQSGIEAEIFAAQNMFYEFYGVSYWNKLIFRLGMSDIYRHINEQFEQQLKNFRPDIVWVFKGMEILPRTLSRLKKEGYVFVNYNPDNPFIFSGRGSGNSNVTQSIAEYPFHFTYNLAIREKLDAEYGVKTFLLPFGFDIDEHTLAECHRQEENKRVCFLGNPDKQRADLIMAIASEGISIDVYGNNWDKFVQHEYIRIFQPAYGLDFWKTLYRYRVQLNLLRKHNEDSHNMRSFEIPGVGAIQLAPDTVEHRTFFTPGKDIFLFNNVAECCSNIKILLEFPDEKATEIRSNARQRSIESGYSYRDRTLQAVSFMNDMLHG